MVSMVDKVLAMLHAKLADTQVGEDAWKLRVEFLLGSQEDFLGCLHYCMQGMSPPSEGDDAWNLPTKIRMGGWHARYDTPTGSK